jgi:CRISPR-associated protein Csd1
VIQEHQAYLQQLQRCAAATNESAVQAVVMFLGSAPLSSLDLPSDFDRGAMVTFRVDGTFVVDLPKVQDFWAMENDPQHAAQPAGAMQCVVCGQVRPVLSRLQGKVKGIPGGQMSGTSIIGMNEPAFESYGLTASLNAPTCATCGERFTKAINALIGSDSNQIRLGDAVFVFWTCQALPFDIRSFLVEPDPADVQRLLSSVWDTRSPRSIDSSRFHGIALSASGGRAVVRDWIDTTVPEVENNIVRWFRRQRILDPSGGEGRPLSLYALAGATTRELREVPPPTFRALLRSALTGQPLPPGLLFQAVRRNRAEQRVTQQRAALIKLALLDQEPYRREEQYMVGLDLDNPSPAYRCGRLLAVLEQVQRLAIPGANTTIVDRFFGTASSAPASVFGRLIRGAQPHLAKLERDNRPAWIALQRRLEDILAGVQGYPRTLTLTEQGLFALGYYHQRAFDRQQARQASGRGNAELASAASDVTAEDLENTNPHRADEEEN